MGTVLIEDTKNAHDIIIAKCSELVLHGQKGH
jgi:hypothetical protein